MCLNKLNIIVNKTKVDESNPDTYIISKLDGKKYTRITYKHTRRFGMELNEYKIKYGYSNRDLCSTQVWNSLGFTKQKSIELYGKIEGLKKWDSYRKKQAETNTFKYKNEKYGMSEHEFKQYNLNRAVTVDNMINRYGEELGIKKWKEYCKLQSYVGTSLGYFIDKYGDDIGKLEYDRVCKDKAITLENMIRVHGVTEGHRRYNSWMQDRPNNYSKVSELLFDDIYKNYKDNNVYYPAIREGKEYCVYNTEKGVVYFYDYVDLSLRKCIEFNGDIFHGNPLLYGPMDTPNFRNRTQTCSDMWKYDAEKITWLKKSRGIETLVVWEKDYKENPDMVYKRCLEFLKYKI